MKGLKGSRPKAPIWSKTFAAAGMSPTVIAYDEIYNAIQNRVIQAGENEAAGVETMKFYEGRPQPQHDAARYHDSADLLLRVPSRSCHRTCRPRSSGGQGGGVYGRQIESSEDQKKEAMQAAGKLKMIPFADRAAMKKAHPVMADYAKDIGAEAIYNKINAM